MISLAQLNHRIANDIADTHPCATNTPQTVTLEHSLGRVLAQDIQSSVAIPAADVSAMDGYAIVADTNGLSENTTLQLIGESIAGSPFTGHVNAGECVRIMTGAVVPEGANSVVMQEHTHAHNHSITLTRESKPRRNIRYQGEELSQGETVLHAGHIIRPADILLLASIGQAQIPVHAPFKVGVFSTGDELVAPGTLLTQVGQLYDSNRAMIKALLQALPVDIIDYGLIADNLERIKATLTQAAQECDIIITSGGVSVGDYDFLKTAVSDLGEIRQYKINMKPGKPFVYGHLQHAWYFGLPGNPVSGYVGFSQIIAPALWQLAGASAPPTLSFQATLSADLRKTPGRQDFQRGHLEQHNQQWHVAPQGKQDSHRIYSLAQANCFIVLEAEAHDKKAGETVTVIPFTHRFAMGGQL